MSVDVRPFTEASFEDAVKVVNGGFGVDCTSRLRKILRNPVRDRDESAGDIVYEDGVPVAFQAAIKRGYYFGSKKMYATIPGMLAMMPNRSPANLLTLVEKTASDRFERKMVVANTAILASQKLLNLFGITEKGLRSCAIVRYKVLKFGGFLRFCSHNRIPRAIATVMDIGSWVVDRVRSCSCIELWEDIKGEDISDFWSRYQNSNQGLVASRTSLEIQWLFGNEIGNGSALLGVRRNEKQEVIGYIVIKESSSTQGRWMVVDWIALNNNKKTLSLLLRGIVRALCKLRPNAFLLESIGFPDEMEDVLRHSLFFSRKAKNNSFVYKAFDKDVEQAINNGSGWFFGPYDGDRCM